MKKMWIVAIVLMFVLAACAKPAEKPAVPVAQPPAEQAPPAEQPPAPEVGVKPPSRPLPSERQDSPPAPVVTTEKVSMSPQLRDLLKRADEKLTSLQYLYGGTETGNLFLDTYFVKGEKMKIRKYEESYYVREGYYDTIYYSLGIACCEVLDRCRSHNVDNTKTKFAIDSSMVNMPKTPYQWVKEIPPDAVIVGPQTFNQRSVTHLKYMKDGMEVLMWVDDTYGVPHKIVINQNGNEIRYQYNDMLFNGLKDTNFDAPCD